MPFLARLSIWKTADFDPQKNLVNGQIIGALWQEEQAFVTDKNGSFVVHAGISQSLLLDPLLHQYLQIEVKQDHAPKSSYFVLDPNVEDITIDREIIDHSSISNQAYTPDTQKKEPLIQKFSLRLFKYWIGLFW